MSSAEELEIVAMLEKLSTQVQQATTDSSPHLDHVLSDAIHATSDLLKSSLPETVSGPWLQELSRFSGEPKRDSSLEKEEKEPSSKEDRPHRNASNGSIHVFAPRDSNSTTAGKLNDGLEQTTCACGTLLSISSMSNDGSQGKHVTCVHGCGCLFHSAKCRRKYSQAHAHDCAALQRKKILKRIGLSADPDLF